MVVSEVCGGFYVFVDGLFCQVYFGVCWNVGELILDGVDYLEGDVEVYCLGYGCLVLILLCGGDWCEGMLVLEEFGLCGCLVIVCSFVDGWIFYCVVENVF